MADFRKVCGSFEVEAWYSGSPEWHFIRHEEVEIRHLKIDDLKDLAYLLSRAIEHHEAHGHKPQR